MYRVWYSARTHFNVFGNIIMQDHEIIMIANSCQFGSGKMKKTPDFEQKKQTLKLKFV